jgi:hypothetical protein
VGCFVKDYWRALRLDFLAVFFLAAFFFLAILDLEIIFKSHFGNPRPFVKNLHCFYFTKLF